MVFKVNRGLVAGGAVEPHAVVEGVDVVKGGCGTGASRGIEVIGALPFWRSRGTELPFSHCETSGNVIHITTLEGKSSA